MTKKEFIKAFADKAGVSQKDAQMYIDVFLGTVEKCLVKGDGVTFVGFGKFDVSKRAARMGRNPQTGKEMKIDAKRVARFKAGATLSKKVNG